MEGGRSLAHGGVSKDGRRVTLGKQPHTHLLMTWQDMPADLGVRGFPQMAIHLMISVSGYLRPSEGLRLTRVSMLPPVAGVADYRGQKQDLTTIRSCWSSPYLVSWIGPLLKVFTELFEFNCIDFLEQFRIGRKRLDLDNLVPYQMRHSGVSIDLNTKFRSLQKAQKRGRWRQHLSVARYEKHARLQDTASRHSAPHCISLSCTRPPLRGRHLESRQERSMPPRSDEGPVRCLLVVMVWDVHVDSWVLQPVLGSWNRCLASQVDTRRLPATYISRGDSWKCSVCLPRCSRF